MTASPRGEADLATRGSGIKLAAELGGRVLAVATSFLVVVGLGVERFGVFAALSGIAVILAELADLGLQGTASRALVAETFTLRVMLRAKLALTTAVGLLAGVLPLLLSAAATALLPVLPSSWRSSAEAGSGWTALLGPLIVYFTLAGWSEFLGVALRARGRRGGEAATMLCSRAATLCAVALAFQRKAGLPGLAWAHVLSALPPLLLSSFLAWRAYGPSQGARAGADEIRDVLRAALPLAVNGGLALVSLRIELLLVFALKGSREAGLFGAALKFVESLNAVPNAVSAGAMPFLTREAIERNGAAQRDEAARFRPSGPVRRRTAGTVALLAVPGAAGVALLAGDLAGLLGPGYEHAAGPLRILAFALVALFMNTVLFHALVAVGRANWLPRLTSLRVAVAAVLAVLLVPRLGALGAAAGFLASELVLLGMAARACAAAGFEVPVAAPVGLAVCVSLPMAVAVGLFDRGAGASAALGVLTYVATLAAAWRVLPRSVFRVLGADGGSP